MGAITAVIALLAGLWTKVLRPGARLIARTEEMLPLLHELTTTFRGTPNAFKVLNEIANQFRTNSGSTLRDTVNRLEAYALESRAVLDAAAAELARSDQLLKVGVETAKQMADQDRETQRQLMLLVDRLSIKIDEIIASGQRIEVDRAQVADNLVVREQKLDAGTDTVAAELADSQQQAVSTTGPPGAAADAASTSPVSDPRVARRLAEEERRRRWDETEAAAEGEP